MLFWLVTLLAILVILSPALMLRPSRRDQRLGALRQHARRAGIGVKFAKPPLHDPPGGLVSYRWAYPQSQPGPVFLLVHNTYASEALKPFNEEWRWRIEPLRPLSEVARNALASVLADLPQDALVLESERSALTLWWCESLNAAAFESWEEKVAAMRDALATTTTTRNEGNTPRSMP